MKIVFVHFTARIPQYLMDNINRVCDIFPEQEVVLITDLEVTNFRLPDNFKLHKILLEDEYWQVKDTLTHPKNFRDNFWFNSIARLIALCNYSTLTGQQILHFESDVLVSNDIPIGEFLALDRPLGYTILGENRGIASVLWISDPDFAQILKEFVIASVIKNPQTTDMLILSEFKLAFPNLVRIFASFPVYDDSFKLLPELIKEDFVYTQYNFDGCFDAADVGQYLFGDDPRNHRGRKYVRKELLTSYFKPRCTNYFYSHERNFINFDLKPPLKIYSLHIHSKDRKIFKSQNISKILQKGIQSQSKPEKKILVFEVFFLSLYKSILRKSTLCLERVKRIQTE